MVSYYPLDGDEIDRLDSEFYHTYDTDHWLHKIRTWDVLLDNSEEFIEEFGEEQLQDSGSDSFESTIKSEIVFTFYHISESLFMFMAASGSHLPWVCLKHIWPNDIEEFFSDHIDGQGGREVLEDIFYPEMRVPEEHEGTMEGSVDFIEEYLPRMAEWYFEREIYNEYKHGLRLSTGEASFTLAPEESPEGEPGEPTLSRGGLSHTYLETEEIDVDEEGNWYQIYRVMSGFDYQLFLDMCHINYLLIDQIIRIRRQMADDESEGENRVEVTSFHDYDVDDIFDYDHAKDWKFRVSYQAGDNVVEFQ